MTSTPQDLDATAQSADLTDFAERLKLVRKRVRAAALDDINERVAIAAEIFRRTGLEEDRQMWVALQVVQENVRAMIEADGATLQ